MQDKSSYSNPNKPQISEGLQDFINAMVEEIVLKGEAFDDQKKKWLKKYSEAEGVDYCGLEKRLSLLIIALETHKDYTEKKLLDLIMALLDICNVNSELSVKIYSKLSKSYKRVNITSEQFNELLFELDSMRHQIKNEKNAQKLLLEQNQQLSLANKCLKQQVENNYNWARELENKLNNRI